METLLPSEIARLVLGYLESEKCMDAAKIFLDTCPHLEECRMVISHGKRFSTRVSGMTLTDIIEKFFTINTIVHDRLRKVMDCEQLKQYGDLLEQLKFLIEETRGQRFVVNINVPSQTNSQICNGSPVISSSTRKRCHSNSEREQCKRLKVTTDTFQQSGSHSIPEATPLESLPGHMSNFEHINIYNNIKHKRCNNSSAEYQGGNQNFENVVDGIILDNPCNSSNGLKDSCTFKKCSAATSTEELLSFSCVEVQTTTPYDTPESESETNDEPIENLSLLTKELLNRTELQERIAENINKAILPTDTSMKDESFNDSVNGEANTSIMAELNNAITSIVEATEADPIFEKFLDEIIGPHIDTETSRDEDVEGKPKSNFLNGQEKQSETISTGNNSPESIALDVKLSNELDPADVPLKHRLRSSSRQQNARTEDEQRDQEKECNILDDQNAAAVLSIINANVDNNKLSDNKKVDDITKGEVRLYDNGNIKKPQIFGVINKDTGECGKSMGVDGNEIGGTIVFTSAQIDNVDAKVKKTTAKRLQSTKSRRRESESNINNYTSDQSIIAMPTLIMCSKDEISDMLSVNSSYPPNRTLTSARTSRFVPIVPKDSGTIISNTTNNKTGSDFVETLYLKAVNVAQKITSSFPSILDESKLLISSTTATKITTTVAATAAQSAAITSTIQTCKKVNGSFTSNSVIAQTLSDPGSLATAESITLYANENSVKTLLDNTSVPTINIDDNVSLSGSGLSPYIKFNSNKSSQNQDLSDIDLTPVVQSAKLLASSETKSIMNDQHLAASKNTECDIINKRTPRSLLRSRSKNHRLSLSTPRRRSNHIRALNFNTPIKITTVSDQTMSQHENRHLSSRFEDHIKSVCRTSLFKSPSFPSVPVSTQNAESPLKLCQPSKLPTTEESLVTKNSEIYSSVSNLIIDNVPSCSNIKVSSENKSQFKSSSVMKETWDADLRKTLRIIVEDNCTKAKLPASNKKNGRVKVASKSNTVTVTRKKDKCGLRLAKGKRKNSHLSKEKNVVISTNDEPAAGGDKGIHVKHARCDDHIKIAETVSSIPDCSYGRLGENINGHAEEKKCKAVEEQTNVESRVASLKSTSCRLPCKSAQKSDSLFHGKKGTTKYTSKRLKSNLNKRELIDEKVNLGSVNDIAILDSTLQTTKPSVDITQQLQEMSKLADLETPRKHESSLDIPPTPRLLSPSTTPFTGTNDDSSQIRSIINTPEFPTTPCIAVTPYISEEIVTHSMKKGALNSCSSYYKPRTEKTKSVEKATKLTMSLTNNIQNSSIPPTECTSAEEYISQNIISSTNTYQACVSEKLEITQFEVIKGNLPKEETIKDLKISSNSRESGYYPILNTECIQSDVENKESTMQKRCVGCLITNTDKTLLNNENSNDSDVSTISHSSSVSSSCSSSTSSSSSSSSSSSTSTSSSSTSSSSSSSASSLSSSSSRAQLQRPSSSSLVPTPSSPPPPLTPVLPALAVAPISPLLPTLSSTACVSIGSKARHLPEMTIPSKKCKQMLKQINRDDTRRKHMYTTKTSNIGIDSPKPTFNATDTSPMEGATIVLRECESSPPKVFSVLKNEEDLTSKETPVKDETLLNEINISETPSSSKVRVDNFTNLSSKISALITTNDGTKFSKSNKHLHGEECSSKRLKRKTNIVNAQQAKENSSLIALKTTKSRNHSSVLQSKHRALTLDEKFVVQLEAKRQRMIAKFQEIPKNNSSREKSSQGQFIFKGKNKVILRKRESRYKHSQKVVTEPSERKRERTKKRTSNTTDVVNKNNKAVGSINNFDRSANMEHSSMTSLTINEGRNIMENSKQWKGDDSKHVQRDDGTTVEFSNYDPKKSITILIDDDPARDVGLSMKQNELKFNEKTELDKKLDQMPIISNENVEHVHKSKIDSNVCDNDEPANAILTQENKFNSINDKDTDGEKESEPKLKEYGDCNNKKTNIILKSKVDLVKRDLFSDEENEHKTFNTNNSSDIQKTEVTPLQICDSSKKLEDNNESHNSKHLSRVLQCLQLVPTCKKNSVEKSQCQYTKYNRKADLNETIPNSVEYHFLYDENTASKKRRRRYSNHELEFQINIVLNDKNHAYVKVMTATAYEEIFNILPKAKKKSGGRKSPIKSNCEKFSKVSADKLMMQDTHVKPLATSSPLENTLLYKVRKVSFKTAMINDAKKSQPYDHEKTCKVNKTGYVEKSNNSIMVKMPKRKTSDRKESKQTEKRQYTTDPQILLSNLDLDKFLTSVHGPA